MYVCLLEQKGYPNIFPRPKSQSPDAYTRAARETKLQTYQYRFIVRALNRMGGLSKTNTCLRDKNL